MARSAPSSSPAVASEDKDPFAGRFTFTEPLRVRAARGTLINTAFTVGLGLLGLLKGFVLARFVSRADYGIWGVIVVSLSTLMWLKQVGIGDKFIQQDEPDQELAFQRAFTLELAVTGACVLVICAALPILVLIYDLPQMILPCLVIALTLVVGVFQAPLWVYYRRMEFARQRLLAAVDPLAGFVAAVALAVAGAGYWAFVGGVAVGTCAASALAVARSPFPLRVRFERATLRRYWSFSGPLLLSGATGLVAVWATLITAKAALGIAAVGVLALADNITGFTEQVDTLVTGTLYPAICAVRDRASVLYESLVKSNRLALMWAVPFGLAITLFCGDLVRFGLGERWRPAIIVLQVYGVTAAVNHVGFNWTAYMRALGRTRAIASETMLATGVLVGSGIPLLLTLGLRGFAIAVALQCLAALALRTYYLQRIFPAFDFLRHAGRAFVPAAPAVAAVVAMRALGPSHRTLGLALAELAVYLILAGAATWQLERGLLREAMSHLLGRRAAVAAL